MSLSDLAGVKVPRHLERRLGCRQTSLPPTRRVWMRHEPGCNGSRITVLQSEGDWAYSSYQTDKRLVVEVRKISAGRGRGQHCKHRAK